MASKNNKPLSWEVKIMALMRDGFVCTYCLKEIKDKNSLSFDHVLPRKRGGTNKLDNVAVCCWKCNQDKGHLLLTQYLRAFELDVNYRIMRFL